MTWIWHGEETSYQASLNVSINYPIFLENTVDTLNDLADTIEMVKGVGGDFMGSTYNFQNFLEDADKPLYSTYRKFTKLSAVIKVFNIKTRSGWSNKSFSDALSLFADILPDSNELPVFVSEAKCCLSVFGMEYKKIHACPNDFILYRKEYEDAIECHTCGTSSYKVKNNIPDKKKTRKKRCAH